MDLTEEYFSGNDNMTRGQKVCNSNSTENVMLKLPKGQRECQSQVRDLMEKLDSWRDE